MSVLIRSKRLTMLNLKRKKKKRYYCCPMLKRNMGRKKKCGFLTLVAAII